MIYNPSTNRIILLATNGDASEHYITEYYMNGSVYSTYQFTYDFGTSGIYNIEPSALFVNNNKLYLITNFDGDVYEINLSTGAPTYVQSITGNTYNFNAGTAASNQCNNVSLSPNITPTPTVTLTPTITPTPTPTPVTYFIQNENGDDLTDEAGNNLEIQN